jgi:hypothetical protein
LFSEQKMNFELMEAIMGYALAFESPGSAYLAPLFAQVTEMPLHSLGGSSLGGNSLGGSTLGGSTLGGSTLGIHMDTKPSRRFTAWRGRSGRRYVTSVFAIHDPAALSYADAVVLAVAPDRQVIAARDSGPFGVEAALSRWRDAAMSAGATEIHVHLLAEDSAGRRDALADLMPVAS